MRENEENVMVLECVDSSTLPKGKIWNRFMVDCKGLNGIRSFVNEIQQEYGDENLEIYDDYEEVDVDDDEEIPLVEMCFISETLPTEIFKKYSLLPCFIISGTSNSDDFETLSVYRFIDGVEYNWSLSK